MPRILRAGLLAIAACTLGAAPAYAAFGYRRAITVQPAQVSGGPLADFPVLVRIVSDANLRNVGNGGHVSSASGYDIQFRASDETTILDHEIESYDGQNGTLWAWVRIPSLSDGTSFYLYYGDPTVTCPLANPGGVWDSSYKAVHHLSGNALDTTTNHNDALDSGTANLAAGQIGRGRNVPVAGRAILQSDYAQYLPQVTLSAWIRWNNTGGTLPRIFDKRAAGGTGASEKTLFINTTVGLPPVGSLRYESGDGNWQTSSVLPAATWRHVAVVDDETNPGPPTIYVDAVAQPYTVSVPRTAATPTLEPFSYANSPALPRSIDGDIDEIRISNVMRTAGWILTEFRNQSAPGTFYAIGPEAVPPLSVAGGCGPAGTTAKDGSLTVGAAGTVLNKYAVLAADAPRGAASLSVTYPGGANGLTALDLSAGDLLLVIQMQGASIDSTNTAQYGTVTALNGAGLHELVTVAGVAGPTINLSCARGLVNGYAAAGRVQVLKVPQYSTLTVNGGASVVAPPWPAAAPFYGGVVAIRAENLSLTGAIDVSGRGFRGGQTVLATGVNPGYGSTVYRTTILNNGAEKGEGIAGNAADYAALYGGRYGRGAPANGGGGGDGHNSSGGGGGNGHNGILWNGQGNPDTSLAGWVTAWNLDPTLNSATTSSGGGRGGYTFSYSNQNALTTAPGNTAWQEDDRREVGGIGGRSLPNDAASRVFMGGGGGAGHVDGFLVGDGGNGGGIVFVLGRTISGTGNILSNGAAGEGTADPDGSGGGGAGGSIVVSAASSVSGVTLRANGGAGGSQPVTADPLEAEGPGGGGGGGFIAVSAPTTTGLTRTANGGANGTTSAAALTEFPPNGATRGGAGVTNATAAALPGGCLLSASVGTGCPTGTVPSGFNLVLNGNFNTLAGPGPGVDPAAQFTSGVPNDGDNTCAAETRISTWSGVSTCTFAVQNPFSGDSSSETPAASNWLYGNGNNTGAPYRLWQQTVAGLSVGQTYNFSVYASSALTPGPTCACTATPAVQFRKDGAPLGPGMEVPIESTAQGDVWQRHETTFTATAASATLAIFDTNLGSLGGDLALTQIVVRACGAPTAVRLQSFEARPSAGAVELGWRTSSELNNLGFHVYRATSAAGPYSRITPSLVPGLGSSPQGASYSYRDSGISAGTTYFYELEDVETTGRTERHGPVSATADAGDDPPSGDAGNIARVTFGDPASNRFRILQRDARSVTLELVTEGFYSELLDDGTLRLTIPDFEVSSEMGSISIPVRRTWLDAVRGVGARISSVEESGIERFSSFRPSGVEVPFVEANRRGVARAARRIAAPKKTDPGIFPAERARLLELGFQGQTKRAHLELAPLSWDSLRGELRLTRRLVVRIAFQGRVIDERSSPARRLRTSPRTQLVTTERGLHVVTYEQLFPGRRGGSVSTASLRLSRLGEPMAFRVEPDNGRFAPGSRLYFLSPGADANPYGSEAVFELELTGGGLRMKAADASPSRADVPDYRERSEHEADRYYQAALLDATDLWFWDVLLAPVTRAYPFEVDALHGGEPARLTVWLQGASDFPDEPDHHVRVYLNGALVSEDSWDGKAPRKLEGEIDAGLLLEGANRLEIENVGDTGALYSMVMLDRFEVDYPRTPRVRSGRFEGQVTASGTLSLSGMGASAAVVDATDEAHPVWLTSVLRAADGSLRFRAEPGHRYLAASADALLAPSIRKAAAVRLEYAADADYLAIAPRAFLPALEPLLRLRRQQGLRARAVAIEDVYQAFGFGEPRPEALRDFLRDTYGRGALRYVLLAGDATYDFKDHLETGVVNQVPPLMVRTSYLWTASDPTLASVHGDDGLPDVAIGRLPAASAEELRQMVGKTLEYESGAEPLSNRIVLITDNPDFAGDFDFDADEIVKTALRGREVERIRLSELGVSETRRRIVQAFDGGPSLVSYVGHGGIHLWADENLLDIEAVPALAPQRRNPLLLTMNCLNGYFHFPYFNSLAEELLKAGDKGVVAAFSPSGLSLEVHAQKLHEQLLEAALHRGHERLGDAVLAAQRDYAASGGSAEILAIYHLLGDPALKLR